MKCSTAVTLLLAMIMAGCSEQVGGVHEEEIHLPSELIANPKVYDGKHVTLRGYVVIGPESRNIFDSKAGYNDARSACLGLDGPDTAFRNPRRAYVKKISGIFRTKICGANDVCLFWCSASGIDLDREGGP